MAIVNDEIDTVYSKEEMAKIIINMTENIIKMGRLHHLSPKDRMKLTTYTALILSELKVWAYKDYGLITNIEKL